MKLAFALLATTAAFAQTVTYTYGINGLVTLNYNGVQYSNQGNPPYISSLTIGGVTTGFENPSARSTTSSPDCTLGTYTKLTFKRCFSTPTSDTLQTDYYVTNTDGSNSITQLTFALAQEFQAPTAANNYTGSGCLCLAFQNSGDQVVSYLSQATGGTWGSTAWWWSDPTVNATFIADYGSAGQTLWDYRLSLPQSVSPTAPTFSIAAGATWHGTTVQRFSTTVQPVTTLAAAGFTAYQSAYPSLITWKDRRMWIPDFIGDGPGTNFTSATNPRGYYSNPALNALDPPTLLAAEVAHTTNLISIMNALSPHPQGVVIWDAEGNEFPQDFTYVGHPEAIQRISPEGLAIIDDEVSRLNAAGYKVGFTLRPNIIQAGAALPATCYAGDGIRVDSRDVFILTTASWPNRSYSCPTTNTWVQAGNSSTGGGVGWQQFPATEALIQAQMETDINYAVSRWGASMFYVDSTVAFSGGTLTSQLWRNLQAEYPNVVFMPEESLQTNYGASMPYQAASAGLSYGTTPAARYIYPYSASFINSLGISSLSPTNTATFIQNLQYGDVPSIYGWFSDPANVAFINSLVSSAATANSSLSFTDANTGRLRSFSALPYTGCTERCYLRVYFASTSNGLASSTTYCEMRYAASCYQSGVASGNSLNLSGMGWYRKDYYYFTGTIYKAGYPEILP